MQVLLNIFISFDSKEEAKSTITLLKDTGYLNEVELDFILKYEILLDSLSSLPNRELLIQQFPNIGFESAIPYSKEVLPSNIELFLNEKRKHNLVSNLVKLASRIQSEGLTDGIKDEIISLTNIDNKKDKGIVNIVDTIEDKYKEEKIIGGILTGVEPIDESTGGIFPGTLTTIMGYTGAYKTLSAVNIAYNAINMGKNVCYISLEVPREHLMYDILSRHSNNKKFEKKIGHFDLKKHKLNDADIDYVFKTILPDLKSLGGSVLFLDESDIGSYTRVGLEQLFRKANAKLEEINGRGIDLLIIDHAQLLKFNESGFGLKDPYLIVNYYTSFLRQQTLSFLGSGRQISTIILSQTSRDGYRNAAKHQGQYDLTAVAEANELERASQNVISLYLDESLKNSKQVKVQVLKARDGATMPEPITIAADPEYYILGSDIIANPIAIDSFNTEDLFSVDMNSINMMGDILND